MAKYLVNAKVTIEIDAPSERDAAIRAFASKGETVRLESIWPLSINDSEGDYYEVVGRCEGCGKILLHGDAYHVSLDCIDICYRCVAIESEAE